MCRLCLIDNEVLFYCNYIIMIWVFDSGLWWVQTAKYIADILPAYDLLVFADSAYAPYGEKNHDWIKKRTFQCLHRMFEQWCSLVIMACNTASTVVIVEWQAMHPDKKVLSVTIPGVEEVIEQWYHHIGVLATKTTIETNLYPHMFAKHFPQYDIIVEQVIGQWLVEAIEHMDIEAISKKTKISCDQFSSDVEAVILWCTHYPIIYDRIKKDLPEKVDLINPWYIAAQRLVPYLQKHSNIAQACMTCTAWWKRLFYTTGDQQLFTKFCQSLRGEVIETKQVLVA